MRVIASKRESFSRLDVFVLRSSISRRSIRSSSRGAHPADQDADQHGERQQQKRFHDHEAYHAAVCNDECKSGWNVIFGGRVSSQLPSAVRDGLRFHCGAPGGDERRSSGRRFTPPHGQDARATSSHRLAEHWEGKRLLARGRADARPSPAAVTPPPRKKISAPPRLCVKKPTKCRDKVLLCFFAAA